MDFLRSCYSTNAAMTPAVDTFGIDWYFVPPSTPFFGQHRFGSLNWSKPNYGSGIVGEVIGASRPWRDGSIPAYVGPNLGHAVAGDAAWFSNGAPALSTRWRVQDWLGRWAPNWDPTRVPLAPPQDNTPPAPTLDEGAGPVPGVWQFGFFGHPGWWAFGSDPFYQWRRVFCGDAVGDTARLTYFTNVPGGTVSGSFRPLTYNAATGVSTWDAPGQPGLPSGFTVTLTSH